MTFNISHYRSLCPLHIELYTNIYMRMIRFDFYHIATHASLNVITKVPTQYLHSAVFLIRLRLLYLPLIYITYIHIQYIFIIIQFLFFFL